MAKFDRLPALPIVVNDPYLSYWMPADKPTEAHTIHWAGDKKDIYGTITVDGVKYGWLGVHSCKVAETLGVAVTPTATKFTMQAGPVCLLASFRTPMLPDDLETLSTPITYADLTVCSTDGASHEAVVEVGASSKLCYDGNAHPTLVGNTFKRGALNFSYVGRAQQHVLAGSGDHITIDWGYLFMATPNNAFMDRNNLHTEWPVTVTETPVSSYAMIGYEDTVSINYFGAPCRAWFTHTGATLMDAFDDFANRYDEIKAACEALDARVLADAEAVGGEDYKKIVAASWRHTFAAHKLICTPKGEMALLSKENDSNGCIGTVDVSYPSTPLFLKYCPELVNALSRPVLEFAAMPVWRFDFAPHDVGRYPYATGQVYAAPDANCGDSHELIYLYDADSNIYDDRYQMPVEECGNMLVMLASAIHFGASDKLASEHFASLEKWVRYLDIYGEDPGEQLCTDDFAGHLNHNVNLSAKAIVGVKCYAYIMHHFGKDEEGAKWDARATEMAASFLERVTKTDVTPLTFDGQGWSMKYNLCWDLVMDLGLLPKEFYDKEAKSYLPRLNTYGLPLDSRSDYTKSDWECWAAALAQDEETRKAILAPVARYLEESKSRVPFSDWYYTTSGIYVAFMGRSVQGGVFMPMLTAK